jgi:FdhD protein
LTAESCRIPVRRFSGRVAPGDDADFVAVEEPLEIRINYTDADTDNGERRTMSLAVTMRTPGDDIDLVAGFLFTEGIVRRHDEIESIESAGKNIVLVRLDARTIVDPGRLQRNFYMTSSCGVCGKASLEALKVQSVYSLEPGRPAFKGEQLSGLPEQLAGRQTIFPETGGLHAAAGFDSRCELLDVREDVGRHNAVDKLVGAVLQSAALPMDQTGILVSGRAGFEIVQKALMAGCPLVASVGAPSSLAVELAWEFDMTLVGFLRNNRFNIYAGPSRIS